jgi:Fic family protein
VRIKAIVDDLFIRPVTAVTWVAAAHGVSYPTARSDLRKLERLGVIREIDKATRISYLCTPIFDVIYAD